MEIWGGGQDVIICASGVLTNLNTKTQGGAFSLFHPGTLFQKSKSAGTENAGSVWTVGPNVHDYCLFTQQSFPCGQALRAPFKCVFYHGFLENIETEAMCLIARGSLSMDEYRIEETDADYRRSGVEQAYTHTARKYIDVHTHTHPHPHKTRAWKPAH